MRLGTGTVCLKCPGENMELFYSDSALLKYKVITPLYNKYNQDDKKYDEFPERDSCGVVREGW